MTLELISPPLPPTVELADVSPFIKWAGGKRQLMGRILPRLPEDLGNYHEPFLGGGALYYELMKRGLLKHSVYLSDLIYELIDAYRAVRNQPESVMDLLTSVMFVNSAESFYEVRSWDPMELDPLTRAARMIFLNKTDFNGLYRVNKSGKFNVAYGKAPNRAVFNRANMLGASWALYPATLTVADFEEVWSVVEPGDFAFFDPPHWQRFVAYTGVKFEWHDQVRLLNTCSKLDRMGVNWMVSNADHPDIWTLYQDFNIERVSVKQVINADPKGRSGKTEVLIRNYEV